MKRERETSGEKEDLFLSDNTYVHYANYVYYSFPSQMCHCIYGMDYDAGEHKILLWSRYRPL